LVFRTNRDFDLFRKDKEYRANYAGTKAKPNNFTVLFNVCGMTSTGCGERGAAFSAVSRNANNTCQHLSGQGLTDQKVFLQDELHPEYGILMKFKHGNKCTDKKNYGLELQVNCDALATEPKYEVDPVSLEVDECHPRVIMSSPAGCPSFSMPSLWRWSDQNNLFIGLLLILIGGFLIGFGPIYNKVSLVTIATVSIGSIVLVLFHALLLPHSTPQWLVWITLLMALGIGAGAGYGVYAWPKAGVVSIGIALGTIFGALIYVMFMSNITGNVALELGFANNSTGTTTVGGVEKTFADIEREEWIQLMASVGVC
jgi:hypothetical protein